MSLKSEFWILNQDRTQSNSERDPTLHPLSNAYACGCSQPRIVETKEKFMLCTNPIIMFDRLCTHYLYKCLILTCFYQTPWDADLLDFVLHNCIILFQKLIYPVKNLSEVSSLEFAKRRKPTFVLFWFCGENIILGFMQCYPLLQLQIHLDRYAGSQELKT